MNNSMSEETIQLILSKTDITDVVSEYVHLKKSGKNYVGLCPFHGEKTPSFSVSPEKQLYHCFGCGAGGNPFTFLMDMEGYSFPQALEVLAEKAGVPLQASVSSNKLSEERSTEKEWALKAHALAAKLFHHMLLEREQGKAAREYVQARGLTLETIKEYEIGFVPESWDFLTSFLEKRHFPLELMYKGGLLAKKEGSNRFFDRFRNRIMFPIKDAQGNVVGFGGRALGNEQPKYLNTPETIIFHKSKLLFNFDKARQEVRKKGLTILFEGFMDVISAWQAKITNGVATLGTSISDDQARMIRRNSEQVLICYDGDVAGVDAAIRAAEIFEKQGCVIKIIAMPQGVDPDDYLRQHGAVKFEKELLAEAKTSTAFRLEMLRRGRNLQDEGDRLLYIREAVQAISHLTHAIERDHYLRQLAQEFSLSMDVLKQEIKREQVAKSRAEKMKQQRDNVHSEWNNSIQHSKRVVATKILPAYHNAERLLLAHMLCSREIAEQVEEYIGSRFNIEEHSAIAAYLYSYYHDHQVLDLNLFLSRLADSSLTPLVTQLSMLDISPELSGIVLQDYMDEVLRHPIRAEIEEIEEEKRRLERQGDAVQAAAKAMEILLMKKKLVRQKNFNAHTLRKEGE